YDGTTAAAITGATLVGVVAGDSVTVSGSGTFASPNAAAGIAVTPALVLSGAASPNYTLTQPTGLSATIARRPVTVRALDVSKTSGESLTAGPGSTAFTASGLLSGDTIGSITITFGPAAAAGTLGGRYSGQAIPSAATGGTFNPDNYAIDYTAGDIVVVTVNQPATSVSLANVVATLPENTSTAAALKLADIVIADDGLGTNVLSLAGPDAAAFAIVDRALFLRAGTSLDFETKTSWEVPFVVSDAEHPGRSVSGTYRLLVTNVNETPTAIAVSAATIAENVPAGTVIGAFLTADPDAGDAFTYTLVAGEGDADNASFTIVGGQLVSAASFNFEMQPTRSVRVRATDAAGASTEQVFTITVTDVEEPLRVEGVEPPPSGFYRAGDTLRFTVVMTRPVTVTGRPKLQFGVGRNASIALFGTGRRTATFASGSGTNRLVFEYRTTAKDNAEQVFLGGALVASRNSISDTNGTRLDVRLPQANTLLPGVLIDASAPRVTGSVGLPPRGTYRAGDVLSFRVSFSENVVVTGAPQLEVRIGQRTRQAAYAGGSGGQQLTFEYIVVAGDATVGRRGITVGRSITASGGATIADAAGNAAKLQLAGPFAAQITVDGSTASASGVQPRSQRTRAAAFAGFSN
ncbi:MAG: cadherin repeat domain-containing protein, partial [Planctomycetia bacterium]|nr:cadherin repeat domain-containing protein [Planctomycetia bacterium]